MKCLSPPGLFSSICALQIATKMTVNVEEASYTIAVEMDMPIETVALEWFCLPFPSIIFYCGLQGTNVSVVFVCVFSHPIRVTV